MSPDRRKIVRLEDSKENWKQKALERAVEIRRLKERLSDVEDSRDSWKAKASDARKELEVKVAQEKEREAGLLSKAGGFFFGLFLLPFAFVALCLFGLWLGLRWLCLRLAFFVIRKHTEHLILSLLDDGPARSVSTSSRRRRSSTEAGPPLLTSASTSEKSASSASSEPSSPELTRGVH